MPTDPKPPKPMPSAEEITAYVEASAARTRLRLPLARGSAPSTSASSSTSPAPSSPAPSSPAPSSPAANVAEKSAQRVLPVSSAKKLPTRPDEPRRTEGSSGAAPGNTEMSKRESSDEPWRPFSSDEER